MSKKILKELSLKKWYTTKKIMRQGSIKCPKTGKTEKNQNQNKNGD